MPSQPRSRLRRIATALIATVAAVAVCEVIVRVAGLAPQFRPIVISDETCMYQRSDNPLLGFEIKPSYRNPKPDLSWSYPRTNAHGQRDVERRVERRPGTTRVVLLGDSVVEGWGILDIDDLMSRQIEKLYPDGSVEVLNFGVSGYCTRAEIELLEVKGLQFQPDVVALVFVQNDFENFSRGEFLLAGGTEDRPAIVKSMFAWSGLFRLLCVNLDLFGFGVETDPLGWHQDAVGDNNVPEGLRRFVELADEHGFTPVIIVWPTFGNDAIADIPKVSGSSDELIIERLGKLFGIPTARISDAFRAHASSVGEPVNYRLRYTSRGDGIHPSIEGSKIAAAAIKRILDGLKPRVPGSSPAVDPEALRSLRPGVAGEPDYATMYVNLGMARQRQGDLDAAAEAFRQALEFDPESAVAHNDLGIVLQRQGDIDGALGHYRRAFEIKPDYVEPRFNFAVASSARQEFAAAEQQYRIVLRSNPDNFDVHFNLGRVLMAQRKFPAAETHLRAAAKLRPDAPQAAQALKAALAAQGKSGG